MRVVRAAGQNVSPSDDGRLYDQIFTDGLFNEPAFTNLGSNNVQVGAIYGDLCGRDFTVEQMTLTVTLPEGEGETTGYIYVEIDTTSEDVISLNSALAPFTPTYEDINTNGAVAQMVLAEYTASAVAVTSVTPVYQKATAGSIAAGSVATVERSQAVSSHSSGDYILLDGKLYLVTASVAIGETFVVGTNIRAAVIGDTLSELKSGLTDQTTMNLTLSNATAGGNTSFVTRKGHEVVLFLDYTLNSAATTVTICNLPKIYRPATTIRQIVPAVDSENPAGIFFVVVYPDGDIVSYATKPKRGYITITYPAGN